MSKSRTLKWLWLTTKPGIMPHKVEILLKYYGNIHNIYNAKNYNVPGFRKKDIDNLLDKDISKAKKVYETVKDLGALIMTCDNEFYPQILKNIRPMPHVLYMRGNPMSLDSILGIGVVGTRNNTEYGGMCAYKFSNELARKGAVIISGLALGIDRIAMSAALKAGGRVIGVLGCGIDIEYPLANAQLYKEVLKSGLIISEYPPGTNAFKGNFPQRNRIIAGLSRGVLIIEGSKKSGSLITAGFANDYNRDVFAVPRNIYESEMNGTNYLIQCGAKLVTNAEDILIEYEGIIPYLDMRVGTNINIDLDVNLQRSENKKRRKINASIKNKTSNIDKILDMAENDLERKIIKLLSENDLYIDEISRAVEDNIAMVNASIILLETKGLIEKCPGNKYKLIQKN